MKNLTKFKNLTGNTIIAKYLSPTNYQGSRIKLTGITVENGEIKKVSVVIPRDFELTFYEQLELLLEEIKNITNRDNIYISISDEFYTIGG